MMYELSFANAKITNVDFSLSCLAYVDMTNANIKHTYFTHADAYKAVFIGAKLDNVHWSFADTEYAIFTEKDLLSENTDDEDSG
jgi:uncharacterized protein YjbI with pentapeptide repeats